MHPSSSAHNPQSSPPSAPQLAPQLAPQYAALYEATLDQAARAGNDIMAKLVVAARRDLKDRLGRVRGLSERDYLEIAGVLLEKNAAALREQYPPALAQSFRQSRGSEGFAAPRVTNVAFDQLELMDAAQIDESVELARSQQSAMLNVDAALNELDTYMCAMLGLGAVQAERNPLRPDVFVRTLQTLLSRLSIPTEVRTDWLKPMSIALGPELRVLYQVLSKQLQESGITAVGYTVARASAGAGSLGAGAPADAEEQAPPDADSYPPAAGSLPDHGGDSVGERRQTVLTLDRLRRLLAGELEQSAPDLASFSEHFSRAFERDAARFDPAGQQDFEVTVPAAFDALQEMNQLDDIVARIGHRRQRQSSDDAQLQGGLQAVRDHLRQRSNGIGQALSLEVVEMMVDNIARDPRLLDPVRQVVRDLEPALLRLALVDPRFFSDKQHPARRLLQELTHRSLAFENADALGFNGFLVPLQRLAGSLSSMPIESAEPFEQVLAELARAWDANRPRGETERAVKVLEHAEQRSLMAEKTGRWIAELPDADKVPGAVMDFLRGPWAQVIAQARLADVSENPDPGKYRELVSALLWSAQPEVTRRNIAKLTRLVSNLLAKLREGLALIEYPSVKTSEFFEVLMKLHQQAFRPASEKVEAPLTEGLHASLLDPDEPWLAPTEAKLSGFMEMSQAVAHVAAEVRAVSGRSGPDPVPDAPDELAPQALADAVISLSVGSWVEVKMSETWIRSQLSWASPQGTLFLFTNAYGQTQSMTRRSRDRMLQTGAMRVISAAPLVEGALDAVAQSALMNSMFLKH